MLNGNISRIVDYDRAEEIDPNPRFSFIYWASSGPIFLSRGLHKTLEVL